MQVIRKVYTVILLLFISGQAFAQHDSTKVKERIKRIEGELKSDSILKSIYEDKNFYYSQMFPQQLDKGTAEKFKLSGYIDTYIAYYTDSLGPNDYQKFPTSAPKSSAFGLNMLLLSGKYQSERMRGVFTLHYGDIPAAAWSSTYNMIQEANIGVRMLPKVWLDAGLFRTHLGFESIQPRENITTSIATTTYYEPYFLSGAKLSYLPTDHLTLQVSAFNGFNTFVETNHNKCVGFSAIYEFNSNFIVTYNNLYCDESLIGERSKNRFYNNIYAAFKSRRWDLGAEVNFGMQQHSKLNDSNATAYMTSALVAAKYKMQNGRFAIYTRGEIFEDSDEILTGPVENQHHTLVGINLIGLTAGIEFKPIPNSYLRLEGRAILTNEEEELFYHNGSFSDQREEIIASMGVWF
jgi:hypothetical protein